METEIYLAVLSITLFLAVAMGYASYKLLPKNADRQAWWSNYLQGVSTELIGAALTIILLTFVFKAIETYATEKNAAVEAVLQLQSEDETQKQAALDMLRRSGWLYSLQSITEDLSGVDLSNENLENVNFGSIGFEAVNFHNANLANTHFTTSTFGNSSLRDTDLSFANLEGAVFIYTHFHNVTFYEANLKNVSFQPFCTNSGCFESDFDETTILPDGSFWTVGTDMTRFTDPDRRHFWRSTNPESPAYDGR
jgi:hypothetical protein